METESEIEVAEVMEAEWEKQRKVGKTKGQAERKRRRDRRASIVENQSCK